MASNFGFDLKLDLGSLLSPYSGLRSLKKDEEDELARLLGLPPPRVNPYDTQIEDFLKSQIGRDRKAEVSKAGDSDAKVNMLRALLTGAKSWFNPTSPGPEMPEPVQPAMDRLAQQDVLDREKLASLGTLKGIEDVKLERRAGRDKAVEGALTKRMKPFESDPFTSEFTSQAEEIARAASQGLMAPETATAAIDALYERAQKAIIEREHGKREADAATQAGMEVFKGRVGEVKSYNEKAEAEGYPKKPYPSYSPGRMPAGAAGRPQAHAATRPQPPLDTRRAPPQAAPPGMPPPGMAPGGPPPGMPPPMHNGMMVSHGPPPPGMPDSPQPPPGAMPPPSPAMPPPGPPPMQGLPPPPAQRQRFQSEAQGITNILPHMEWLGKTISANDAAGPQRVRDRKSMFPEQDIPGAGVEGVVTGRPLSTVKNAGDLGGIVAMFTEPMGKKLEAGGFGGGPLIPGWDSGPRMPVVIEGNVTPLGKEILMRSEAVSNLISQTSIKGAPAEQERKDFIRFLMDPSQPDADVKMRIGYRMLKDMLMEEARVLEQSDPRTAEYLALHLTQRLGALPDLQASGYANAQPPAAPPVTASAPPPQMGAPRNPALEAEMARRRMEQYPSIGPASPGLRPEPNLRYDDPRLHNAPITGTKFGPMQDSPIRNGRGQMVRQPRIVR